MLIAQHLASFLALRLEAEKEVRRKRGQLLEGRLEHFPAANIDLPPLDDGTCWSTYRLGFGTLLLKSSGHFGTALKRQV